MDQEKGKRRFTTDRQPGALPAKESPPAKNSIYALLGLLEHKTTVKLSIEEMNEQIADHWAGR